MGKQYADIVVVDSGVGNGKSDNGVNLLDDADIGDLQDKVGHGTAVYYLIKQYVEDIDVYHIKIFDKEYCTDVDELVRALEYVYYNIQCRVVHLSNGIVFCEDLHRLQKCCDRLVEKGIIIVAAFDNCGSISYPAAFKNVIGVDISEMITKNSEYYYVKNSYVNVILSGRQLYVPWINADKMWVQGSSFAAPYVSAMILKYLRRVQNADYQAVLRFLEENAYKVIEQNSIQNNVNDFAIHKAITFPFNKEIKNILKFDHLIYFEIVGTYDIKYLNNVGTIVEGGSKKYSIENYQNIDWDTEFDTIILGHTKELSNILHMDMIELFINLAIENHKNLYCFDDISPYKDKIEILRKQGNDCFCPKIESVKTNFFDNGKLRNIGKPVIGVWGTGSKQGKFTLQLLLREKFLREGYRVGQLGTEPSSLLYGFDECYPMGYSSTVEVKENEAIYCVNQMMGRIEDKNPDVIIVGSQSQTIPLSMGNLGFYTLYNVELLLATAPDVICLCVNMNDEIQYIERTILFLENYIETEVIAIVLFPVLQQKQWSTLGNLMITHQEEELKNKKIALENKFGRRTCILSYNEDMDQLYHELIDYFED